MTENKSLWNWYQDGSISSSERSKILEIGYIDNSPQLYLSSWRKLYHYQLIIDRLKSKINIPGRIHALILISTYWNPNCVVVISGEYIYSVNVLIYEMSSRKMEEILETKHIDDDYYSLSDAKTKAYEVERRLNGNNPITFYQLPNSGFVVGSSGIVSGGNNYLTEVFPLTKMFELPFQVAKNNPDDYIKPLDIVKIAKSHYDGFIHTCVYLGNGKVVHNLPSGGVRFDSFSNFASFGGCSIMARYHPVVAYKRREQIIEHIGKIMGGDFNIRRNNCENFANKCIYNDDISEHAKGLNAWSETTKGREETTTTYSTETHWWGTSRVVMVSKTLGGTQTSCGASQQVTSRDFPTSTEQFDRLPRNYSTENEIKRYVESQSHYNGIILEQRIEIAPKSEYRMS